MASFEAQKIKKVAVSERMSEVGGRRTDTGGRMTEGGEQELFVNVNVTINEK